MDGSLSSKIIQIISLEQSEEIYPRRIGILIVVVD